MESNTALLEEVKGIAEGETKSLHQQQERMSEQV